MSIENAPRWFLIVAIVSVLAVLPFLIKTSDRLTVLETRLAYVEELQARDSKRIITVIDRLDGTVSQLNSNVIVLNTEVKNLKEK